MKEKIEMIEVEAERMEMVDLGVATEETRQWHPVPVTTDSSLQFGRTFFE